MDESFKETKGALSIKRGMLWVSQHNFPVSPIFQERVRGKSILIFSGVDHLELSVADARTLRDWLTSVLPDSAREGQ